MKRVLYFSLLAIEVVAFSSCKKDYNCTCKAGNSVVVTTTLNTRKRIAEEQCTKNNPNATVSGHTCETTLK